MKPLVSFIVGIFFSLGLAYSGMTQPHIVRGFLDVFGQWDPRLVGVMLGAIAVHSFVFYFIKKRASPLLDTKFHLPTKKDLDLRLIMGSVLFGLGWGWAGICPGPGIVAMTSGHLSFLYFVMAMLVGMKSFQLLEKKWSQK